MRPKKMLSFNFKKIDNPASDNLEEALRRAVLTPRYWPEFYEKLLQEDIFVLTQDSGMTPGVQTLGGDTELAVASLDDGRIPIFSSKHRIFDGGTIQEEVQYVSMQGRALLSLLQGQGLVLNPYSDYLKELLPQEIAGLLQDDNGSDAGRTAAHTQVQIGQPALYPSDVAASLCRLFAVRPNVRAAYLGWLYNPPNGELPHYIFALDAEEEGYTQLTTEAGFVAGQWLLKDENVEFIKIKKGDQLSRYFTERTKPFYQKT